MLIKQKNHSKDKVWSLFLDRVAFNVATQSTIRGLTYNIDGCFWNFTLILPMLLCCKWSSFNQPYRFSFPLGAFEGISEHFSTENVVLGVNYSELLLYTVSHCQLSVQLTLWPMGSHRLVSLMGWRIQILYRSRTYVLYAIVFVGFFGAIFLSWWWGNTTGGPSIIHGFAWKNILHWKKLYLFEKYVLKTDWKWS